VNLNLRIAHDRLRRICFNDYDREIALVAEALDPGEGEAPVVGIGRLTKLRWTPEGRIALMVTDLFQGQGLGSEILRRLLDVGRAEGLERILLEVAPDNRPKVGVKTFAASGALDSEYTFCSHMFIQLPLL